jgi:hypothetical protein
MDRGNDIGIGQQWMVKRCRLLLPDIQARSGKMPRMNRLRQREFVVNAAASGADEEAPTFMAAKRSASNRPRVD